MMGQAWKFYTWSFVRHLAMLTLFGMVDMLTIQTVSTASTVFHPDSYETFSIRDSDSCTSHFSSVFAGLCRSILHVVNEKVVDLIGQPMELEPVPRWVFRVLRFFF